MWTVSLALPIITTAPLVPLEVRIPPVEKKCVETSSLSIGRRLPKHSKQEDGIPSYYLEGLLGQLLHRRTLPEARGSGWP